MPLLKKKSRARIKKGPQSTRAKKAKGQVLQKWVCKQISELLNTPYGKDELIAPRESGQQGVDVRLVGHIKDLFPFSIECKNHETWNMKAFIDQAKAQQLENTSWLLVLKKASRKKSERIDPVVVMDALEFFKLLRKIYQPGETL